MYSSLRDGLQPNQESGIFLWPLPGPFPCSHLLSIIPDREENGNRKYRNYVCRFWRYGRENYEFYRYIFSGIHRECKKDSPAFSYFIVTHGTIEYIIVCSEE